MVDIHCHIVPGVDDGAPDIATALDMIREAKHSGVTAILTTPHIRAHPAENATHKFHQEAFRRLLDAHRESDVHDVELMLGGEVRVTADTQRILDEPTFTAGEKNKFILLELSSQEVPPYFSQVLFEFRLRDITPIVAHPERNLAVLKRPEYAIEFVQQGAHLQLTTSSINGELGPTIERAALAMLKAGIVSFVASDAHNTGFRSFKSWEKTRAIVSTMEGGGAEMFEEIGNSNPLAVFDGSPLEPVEIDASAEQSLIATLASSHAQPGEKRKRFFFF